MHCKTVKYIIVNKYFLLKNRWMLMWATSLVKLFVQHNTKKLLLNDIIKSNSPTILLINDNSDGFDNVT